MCLFLGISDYGESCQNVDCNCNNLESDTAQTKSMKLIRKRKKSRRGMKSSGSNLFLGPVFISNGFLQSTEVIRSSSDIVPIHPCPPKVRVYEEYVSGYGSKILAKMGYSGGGLGKKGGGILQPLQPVARPKLLGLGFKYLDM